MALSGRTFGEFVVREKIGQGGFGEVYRAEQPALAREAVVKVLKTRHRGAEAATQRFLREAFLASRLDHPYAAHVYAFGAEPDGVLWIAMELVRGTPLSQLIATQGPMALDRFVPFLERLCEVVHTAHEQKIVHRDIKPGNVMVIARAGRFLPKLLDFGIGKSVDAQVGLNLPVRAATPAPAATAAATGESREETGATPQLRKVTPVTDSVRSTITDPEAAARDSPELDPTVMASPRLSPTPHSDGAMTEAGMMIGSPPYMSPEQWRGAVADARSDLYALGVLTYETLTGRLPFLGKTVGEWKEAHAHKPVPPLGDGFPAALDAVIARALAKRAEDRFQGALELAAALREAAGISIDEPAPALDVAVRERTLLATPPAIAEAVSALDGARNPHQAREAIHDVVCAVVRTVGVWALAARAQVASPAADDRALTDLLGALRERLLDETEWLELARAACRPFADLREVHPLPELVGFCLGDGAAAAARLLDASRPGRASGAEVREWVARALPELARLLDATAFLSLYPVVVARAGGAAELWMGLSRTRRPAAPLLGGPHDEDQVFLTSGEGRPVISLSPLAQVAAPAPGAPPELFLFDGGGRARLVSAGGFERHDPELWSFIGSRLLGGSGPRVIVPLAEAPPYRGLDGFSRDDADFFFGRERETDVALNRLRAQPLVAVVGPSGAGKSSFVQAGLLPALPPAWYAVTIRPGAEPMSALAARVAKGLGVGGSGDAPAHEVAAVARALSADPDLFGRRAAEVVERGTLVVIVDQLEELVTQCHDPDERRRFAECVARAPHAAAGRLKVVCTIRDDFLVKLDELPAFRDRLTAAIVLLATPAPADLVRIVVEPARSVGYEFDDRALPERMVAEVAGRAGALPLLSFTASRLWELRDRAFKKLTLKAYEAMGGVGGALAGHAEATLHALPADEQRLVRVAFRHLVTADGTRATLARGELADLLGGGRRAEAVIDRLVDARLLVSRDDETGGSAGVEIIHETLLTAWPRLVRWQKEDAEGARLRDQLRAAARQWDERGRPKGLLWRGDALDELRLWRKRQEGALTSAEEAFVQRSLAEERSGRRARGIAAGAVFLSLVAGVFLLWRSNRQTEAARREAHDRMVTLYHEQGRQALLAGDVGTAFVNLLEAYRNGDHTASLRVMLHRATHMVGAQLFTLEHAGAVWGATFSSDGKSVLTASNDGTAALWSVTSGQRLITYAGADQVWDARFTTGGRVVTIASDGNLRLYAAEGGAPQGVLDAHESLRTLTVSADGARVAVGGLKGGVIVWDLDSGQRLLSARLQSPVSALAFSPDGARLAAADDHELRAWSVPDGRDLEALDAGTVANGGFTFSADGARLVAPCGTTDACIFALPGGALQRVLKGHTARVRAANFGAGDKFIVTSSDDHTAKLWNAADGRFLRSFDAHASEILWSELSADGNLVLTASADATVLLWDARAGRVLLPLVGHRKRVRWAHFSPDGALVLTAGGDGTARVWRSDDGEIVHRFTVGASPPVWCGYAGNSALLALSPDKVLHTLDAATGAERSERRLSGVPIDMSQEGAVFSLQVGDELHVERADGTRLATWPAGAAALIGGSSPDGRFLATGPLERAGDVEVREVASGRRLGAVHAAQAITAVTLSRDGGRVAIGYDTGEATLCEVASGRCEVTLRGHERRVSSVTFDPEERRLATTSLDQTIRLWRLDGTALQTLQDASETQFVIFAPGGDLLFSTNNVEARVWEAASGRLVQVVPTRAAPWIAPSPSGLGLAVVDAGGGISVWDMSPELPSIDALDELARCRLSRELDRGGNLVVRTRKCR